MCSTAAGYHESSLMVKYILKSEFKRRYFSNKKQKCKILYLSSQNFLQTINFGVKCSNICATAADYYESTLMAKYTLKYEFRKRHFFEIKTKI
jgi:hypothetical protein